MLPRQVALVAELEPQFPSVEVREVPVEVEDDDEVVVNIEDGDVDEEDDEESVLDPHVPKSVWL